eukprot:TRINITY_DN6746_c0_g1_i1.p1 TRINITY_DN6746_c0_g1~~TRINITY_DN6746_c0_g1_i1.p1  ORF type:complete len:502 (-),score=71.68 TRINITY_DN6746_c0_g1_i1:73-1578(-)
MKFLRGMVIAIAICYIPLVSNILGVFHCTSRTCSPGQRFPDDLSDVNTRLLECEACAFYNETCPAALSAALCPGATEDRLNSNISLLCNPHLSYFFWPAAIMMVLCFVLGIPGLFLVLIRGSSAKLKEYPLDPQHGGTIPETKKWLLFVVESKNASKSLYSAFTFHWRYWELLMLCYKLLIVVIAIFLAEVTMVADSFVAMAFMGLAHGGWALFTGLSCPYQHKIENRLSTSISTILTLDCVVGVLIITEKMDPEATLPSIALMALLVLNLAVPVMGVLLLVCIVRHERKMRVHYASTSRLPSPTRVNAIPDPAQIEDPTLHLDSDSDNDTVDNINADAQQRQLQGERNLLDKQISDAAGQHITRFFLFIGVMTFLSLAACVSGIMYHLYFDPVLHARPYSGVAELEFAGYEGWDEFTRHCCCMDASTSPALSLEKWVCRNGRVRFRLRQEEHLGLAISGLPMRPFCSRKFTDGCAVSNATVVMCLPGAAAVGSHARRQLW